MHRVAFVEEAHAEVDLLVPVVLKPEGWTRGFGDELEQFEAFVPFYTHYVARVELYFWFLEGAFVGNPAVGNSKDVLWRFLLVFGLTDAEADCQPGRSISVDFDGDINGVIEFRKIRIRKDSSEFIFEGSDREWSIESVVGSFFEVQNWTD